ncbi:T9SS type A sorting domain-containing protein [Hymenobacter koreensis]|uniref:Secretion system C-terminal sorting domain-containing protein n=1 Tax=Hymenobacter koreensis TaxID=1084523 RepID=A0ABP8IZ90_9BACT
MIKHSTHFVFRGTILLLLGLIIGVVARAQGPALDPTFQPPVVTTVNNTGQFSAGIINDVVRQPDGKYIVGGQFTHINGIGVANLARLLPNGTLDATFLGSADAEVMTLVQQPDGKILVGGLFGRLSGGSRLYVGRLLPDGNLDAAFGPFASPASTGYHVSHIALQPDGGVLIGGEFNVRGPGSTSQRLARLTGSGQYDAGFQPNITGSAWTGALLIQPDGKILFGGLTSSYVPGTLLTRLLPNGAIDNTFTIHSTAFVSGYNELVLDQAGRIYAAGTNNSFGVRRYSSSGTLERTFLPMSNIGALAMQPNGRLLASTDVLNRLLPDGSVDAGFSSANGPTANGYSFIRRILVQPDGAILAAGAFTLPGSTTLTNLVRLTDANVLRVRAATDARLVVWPLPAHDELNIRWEGTPRAERVQLLDVLGRAVCTLDRPADEQRIAVRGLPAGTYQLQVLYADGSRATRRVVVQ